MKVLCVLYDDPKGGMPKSYPLSSLPKLDKYPDGMKLPTPKAIDLAFCPESRITPMPDLPLGVDIATIVSFCIKS